MLAIVAPGQGAQRPGFLSEWLEDERSRDYLDMLGQAASLDLLTHGTISDEATITDTAVAQPLLVGAALLTAQRLLNSSDVMPDLVAGHSVGEFVAATLAGVLTDVDALRLVGVRGRAMAEAAAMNATSMVAVIGGEPKPVLEAIEAAGLTAANFNGQGQVVAAGTIAQIAALELPRRAMAIPLQVAGAFHTTHMAPAVDALRRAANGVVPRDPSIALVSNSDGAAMESGPECVDRLVAQVAQPVRWDACMDTMAARGVTGVLELAPAGTLTGLVRRNLKGVERFALDSPAQLDEARLFCRKHATAVRTTSVG